MPTWDEAVTEKRRQWRYIDNPDLLEAISDNSWLDADYDDSKWSRSEGSFGAEEGQLLPLSEEFVPDVLLQHYKTTGETVPTYLFRYIFTVDSIEDTYPLTSDIFYDDAVIVYLNGQPIFLGNTAPEGYDSINSYGCETSYGSPISDCIFIENEELKIGENVLAVELHQANNASSDIYFDMGPFSEADPAQIVEYISSKNESLYLGAGSDQKELLITWRDDICDDPYVQITDADNPVFNDDTPTYKADAVYPDAESNECTYRCKISNLSPGDYLYRVVAGKTSDVFDFNVPKESSSFSFLACGDPQLLDSRDMIPNNNFQSLAEAVMGEDIPEFVLSLGDQVDDGDNQKVYKHFTSIPLFKSVPLAPIVGNHERKYEEFSRSFYMPNMDDSTIDRSGDMSGDYWLFRNNTLFICLNTNNSDVESHIEFMSKARSACEEKYGTPKWTIAAVHFSFFSAGKHSDDDNIVERRNEYAAAFADAGVDIVFSGHDHSYTRSLPINSKGKAAANDKGVTYISLGSSTGSKQYPLKSDTFDYVAFSAEGDYPQMARIDITQSSLTVKTFEKRDESISLLDEYILEK